MSELGDVVQKVADPLIAKAENAVPALVASWVSLALAKGAGFIPDLPEAVQPIVKAILEKVEANKDAIAGVAKGKLVSIVNLTAAGKGEQARLIYLASTASSFEDRFQDLQDASDATRAEVSHRTQAWQKVKGWAEDVVLAVTKAAIVAAL